MRRFLLRWLLPTLFALCLVGAFVSLTSQRSDLPAVYLAAGPLTITLLLASALWCALLWIILLPTSASPRHQQDQRHRHHEHKHG